MAADVALSAAAKHIVWQALHCFTGALPSPTPADLSFGFYPIYKTQTLYI